MAKKVFVLTDDSFLFQKIYLSILSEGFIAERAKTLTESEVTVLVDIDTVKEAPSGALTMSRSKEVDLAIPFSPDTLLALLSRKKESGALLTLGDKCAYLRDREIRLTEVEYSLLSLLIKKGGFASREEILMSVWGEGAEGGVLNVYIHYLREKLEWLGEKIIIASRGQGYKIDENLR